MSKRQQIQLSHIHAPDTWGDNTLLSHDGELTTIHIPEPELALERIQKAARSLSSAGLQPPELVGHDWDLERQWAFAQGYYSTKQTEAPVWAQSNQEHIDELQHRFIAADWVRRMMNKSPEDLAPEVLLKEAATFIRTATDKIEYEFIVGEELEKQGYVGTWQVGRGSNRPPAVLRLDFNPTGDDMAPVEAALVGKGITFDSGGYSIKTSEGMLAMKMDMGGAAYVAGALWLAIKRGLNKRVRMYLCCAENLISGHAYKLGDVIKYPNGTTVEIVNTDAEGRIVMADGLLKATEANIPLVIDAATLTGAAHVAVGNEYNALFSLDDALAEKALKAAADESEPLWRLPLAPFHRHKCPSPYADTANSVPTKGGGAGGASNAAGFLSRFVNKKGSGWLHFDLSGAFYGKDTASWSAGGTAMGIRTIARLLTDQL